MRLNNRKIIIYTGTTILLIIIIATRCLDFFFFFNEDNRRYTIGTYYKDAFIINSSSSKEKGFIYYVDSIKHVATTGKFNNTDISHTHVLIMFSAVFHGNAKVLSIIVPKWVLAPPKAGWEQ